MKRQTMVSFVLFVISAAVFVNTASINSKNVTETDSRKVVNNSLTKNDTNSTLDTDSDGISDDVDNCKLIPNPEQYDVDGDGIGDKCDEDMDNDGIPNAKDSCPLVYNPDQRDTNNNGLGDECEDVLDQDNKPANKTNWPNISLFHQANFTKYQSIVLDPDSDSPDQENPHWEIRKNGTEIVQTSNSGPGLAIGYDYFSNVEFQGTIYVDSIIDDDYLGIVFSYKNSKQFYTVMWKKNEQTYWQSTPFRVIAERRVQIKLVNSDTGPGPMLTNALWHTGDTPGQVKTLWKDPENIGWKEKTCYGWSIVHKPFVGLIRLKIFKEGNIFIDSGDLYDSTLQGGRLGVLSFSQEMVIWSDLKYKRTGSIN